MISLFFPPSQLFSKSTLLNSSSWEHMEVKSDGFTDGVAQSTERGADGAQQDKGHKKQQSDEGRFYNRPPSCFGCGIGWLCFILGFAFPLFWYIATALYFGKYYLKDPRERAGLAASAIAALICSVAALIILVVVKL